MQPSHEAAVTPRSTSHEHRRGVRHSTAWRRGHNRREWHHGAGCTYPDPVTDPSATQDLGPRFPCVCCGHVVFDECVGSHEICPVCFWEDDLVQARWPSYTGGANTHSLVECQRNYQALGAKRARALEHVRPANENEPLEAGWYPLAPTALAYFEPTGDHSEPWPQDRTVLYWWRATFWRVQPPRWNCDVDVARITDPDVTA